jgi:type IV pilus assembly protein PilN
VLFRSGTATPINIQASSGETPEVQNLEPPGTITFNGFARPEYQNISDFIVRMNNLRFLANASLTNARLDRDISPPQGAVEFEVSANLVTRVGENGDEVPIGIEEDGEAEDQEEPLGPRASRPGSER